jgi:predicted Abi (CAAX) family protease
MTIKYCRLLEMKSIVHKIVLVVAILIVFVWATTYVPPSERQVKKDPYHVSNQQHAWAAKYSAQRKDLPPHVYGHNNKVNGITYKPIQLCDR